MKHRAALRPFRSEPDLNGFRFNAGVTWHRGVLELDFSLIGPLDALLIPTPVARPQRRDGLWQGTCFEAFLAIPGQKRYWEINLAPSGDWNLYALNDYRQGLQPEPAVQALPGRWQRDPGHGAPAGQQRLDLNLSLDLSPLIPADSPLEVSATAVLAHAKVLAHADLLAPADPRCSYWAWRHVGSEADFHRRDSFLQL